MIEKTFPVTPVGVGRKDYSQSIEAATQQYIRSYQRRVVWGLTMAGVPSLPFGFLYASPLVFLQEDGTIYPEASVFPYHIFNIRMVTDRNTLLIAGLYRWDSFARFMAGLPPDQILAEQHGYGTVDIDFVRGVKTVDGSTYVFIFNEIVGPTFNFNDIITGIRETVPE